MGLTVWSPTSFRAFPREQRIDYPDADALSASLRTLSALPALVTDHEIERLRGLFQEAERGERFVVQAGDCAETFGGSLPAVVRANVRLLLEMSDQLEGAGVGRVLRIARVAGQYAKPRSAATETRTIDGREATLPNYFGDLVNRSEFTAAARSANPTFLVEGHQHATSTLDVVRQVVAEGAEDPLFVSHEGLHLEYEAAQTRRTTLEKGFYCLSTHFPWIGERTRQLSGAHVEYFRGIRNPVGVKLGPSTSVSDTLALLRTLNPHDEAGKIVLITRMGESRVGARLPEILRAVRESRRNVLFLCDPMHGNTHTTAHGLKTRAFDAIASELAQTFAIHRDAGTRLGGVHLEITSEDVTECTGGPREIQEADVGAAYSTACDPRLNRDQALELARRLGELARAEV